MYIHTICLLKNKIIRKFGFKDFPACGTYDEVLGFHKLDSLSIAQKIAQNKK